MVKFYAAISEGLTTYARQVAWFSSVPRDTSKTAVAEKQRESRTRAQDIIARGGTPLYPRLDGEEYLLGYWLDLGMCSSGANGYVPLGAAEIDAWTRGTGVELQPWEFGILRQMSRAYLEQLAASEKPDCPPPYGDPVNVFDRGVVSAKITNQFKAMLQARKR